MSRKSKQSVKVDSSIVEVKSKVSLSASFNTAKSDTLEADVEADYSPILIYFGFLD